MFKPLKLVLPALVVLSLSGCFGFEVDLPPVKLDLDVLKGAVLDPALLNGAPEIANTEIYLGEFCDVPTVSDVEALVRAQLGDKVGGLIHLQRIDINEIRLTAREGDFEGVTVFGLAILNNLQPHFLGLAPTLGAKNEITLDPPNKPDLLDILPKNGNCLSAIATLTGDTPEEPVTLDVSMKVTVHSGFAF